MVEVGQQVRAAEQDSEVDAEEAVKLARAQLLAHHVLSLQRIRATLTLAGGIGPETALRLLETQRFLTQDLSDIGHLALLSEAQPEEHIEGRKSLPL